MKKITAESVSCVLFGISAACYAALTGIGVAKGYPYAMALMLPAMLCVLNIALIRMRRNLSRE